MFVICNYTALITCSHCSIRHVLLIIHTHLQNDEKISIFRILSAVIHLGNIVFQKAMVRIHSMWVCINVHMYVCYVCIYINKLFL